MSQTHLTPNSLRLAALKDRLAQAQARAGRLKVSGSQERYLEAYFVVQGLETQLDAMLADQHGPR
jgi:hypothetical protein